MKPVVNDSNAAAISSNPTARLPVQVKLQPVDANANAALMYDWSRRPHVREYWELGEDLTAVREYLRRKSDSGYLQPYIIQINGETAGYAELYEYNRDPVALVFPGRPDSRGWHIFLGEERFIGSGHALYVGRAILNRLFAYPDCEAVYCEPDIRNARMHRFVQKLGHREVGRVHLPDKTAYIMQCDHADFEQCLKTNDREGISRTEESR